MSYLKLSIISLMCIFFQQIVHADTYPSKPLRLIVPAAAGGTTDIAARTIADPLAKELGQSVIVDIKAGAAAIIGTQALVSSPADGYTDLNSFLVPPLKRGISLTSDYHCWVNLREIRKQVRSS